MVQKLGGIIWNAIILAGFIYLLLVMKGKVQPPQPVPMIQKPTLFVKILVYLGVAVFGAALILEFV